MLWMESGDWVKALALQDEVFAVCPLRAVPVLDRATCLIELGREAEAERLLAADAPELRDKFPRNVLLARIAARRGDAGRAADLLRGAFDAERRRFVQGFFAHRLAAGGRPLTTPRETPP